MTDDERPRVWLCRAGKNGEREDYGLEQGLTGGGFPDVPDLSHADSREEVDKVVRRQYLSRQEKKIPSHVGQLHALRNRMLVGDLAVLPRKHEPKIAIGRITGGYEYRSDNDDPALRHFRPVDWLKTDVPRTAIKQDLLYTLGGSLTIFEVTRNDGAWRVAQVSATGRDPGARTELDAAFETRDAADDADAAPIDLKRLARDQIVARLSEEFAGHALAELVGDVLWAGGLRVLVAPPGPDGGVDVFAGSGPLGLDSPRLVVQVKSGHGPVDVKVIRELQGVANRHSADQVLLVAWGGLTTAAERELRDQFFKARVWDADELLDAVLDAYEKLPDETRSRLPLRRIWTLVDDHTEDDA